MQIIVKGKPLRYKGKLYRTGDAAHVSRQHARVLTALRRADFAPATAEKPHVSRRTVPTTKEAPAAPDMSAAPAAEEQTPAESSDSQQQPSGSEQTQADETPAPTPVPGMRTQRPPRDTKAKPAK